MSRKTGSVQTRWIMVAALLLVVAVAVPLTIALVQAGRAPSQGDQGLRLTPTQMDALRETYPIAVEEESSIVSLNPFGSHMVRRADAYVVAEVVETMPEFIHPDPTAVDREVTAAIANAQGAVVVFQSMYPRAFERVAYRLRITETLCRRGDVAESSFPAGQEIVASVEIGWFQSYPVFTPGTRIVIGLSSSSSDMGYTRYVFHMTGTFYAVDGDYVLPAFEEFEPSLCAGLQLGTFRQRLQDELKRSAGHISFLFHSEEALVASLDGGGGLYPVDALEELAGMAERFRWQDSGWFRLANLPDTSRIYLISLASLPERVTQRFEAGEVAEHFVSLQWTLDETDTDAQLAVWIQQGSLVESGRSGIFINMDPKPDTPFEQVRTAAWIQYSHCFRLIFEADITREEALDLCDVERAKLG